MSAKSTSKRTFSRQSFTVKTTRDCGEQEMRTNNAIPRPSADSFECASVLAFRIAAVSGCFYTEGVDRMTGVQTRRLVNPRVWKVGWGGGNACVTAIPFVSPSFGNRRNMSLSRTLSDQIEERSRPRHARHNFGLAVSSAFLFTPNYCSLVILRFPLFFFVFPNPHSCGRQTLHRHRFAKTCVLEIVSPKY